MSIVNQDPTAALNKTLFQQQWEVTIQGYKI